MKPMNFPGRKQRRQKTALYNLERRTKGQELTFSQTLEMRTLKGRTEGDAYKIRTKKRRS